MTHIKSTLLVYLFALIAPLAMAQSENQLPIEFKSGAYVLKDNKTGLTDTLPYQLVLPDNFQPGNTYPLMVLLHGSGERGMDNQAQLKHFLPLVNNGAVRRKYPFIYVIPQCPKGKSWSHLVFARDSASFQMPKQPTRPLQMVNGLLQQLGQVYKIDSKHQYISGLSMGGFGTLEFVAFYPKIFKAALPVCGGVHPDLYNRVGKTPLWLFHGDADKAVKVGFSRRLVDALRDRGGKIVYTELPGVQHDSWVAAYSNPLWLDWMWAQ